ncbi:MAG: hypothetical protein HC801_06755 [Nitrospira sp.]|nr:hypothetical protein [Nitrospira sp.]
MAGGSTREVNGEEVIMVLRGIILIAICGISLTLAVSASAQVGGGQQDAAKILNGMPPDVLAKVQSLAQILQQNIKEGKLTDNEIKQEMMSGHLGEKLRQLNPEAGQLLEEISEASKQGKGPGEESLLPLLGGLGISPE